jgi:hypothetical protein
MLNNFRKFAGIIFFLYAIQTLTAQETGRQRIELPRINMLDADLLSVDTMAIVPKDSMFTAELSDTLIFENIPAPDED